MASGVTSAVGSAASDVSSAVSGVTSAVDSVASGVSSVASGATSALSSGVSGVTSVASGIVSEATSAVAGVSSVASNVVSSAVYQVTDIANSTLPDTSIVQSILPTSVIQSVLPSDLPSNLNDTLAPVTSNIHVSSVASSVLPIHTSDYAINVTAPTIDISSLLSSVTSLPSITSDIPLPIQTNGTITATSLTSLLTVLPTGILTDSGNSSVIATPTITTMGPSSMLSSILGPAPTTNGTESVPTSLPYDSTTLFPPPVNGTSTAEPSSGTVSTSSEASTEASYTSTEASSHTSTGASSHTSAGASSHTSTGTVSTTFATSTTEPTTQITSIPAAGNTTSSALETSTVPTELPSTTLTTKPTTTSTTQWFSSALTIAPDTTSTTTATATGDETTTTTTSIQTGIPSNLPKVITPAGGMPEPPKNHTLVRLGFLHALNYRFVVENPVAVAQIFEYLPHGICYGLKIDSSDVIMHTLQPYDTTKTRGYITTLAFAYIPEDLVSTFDLDRHTPAARLFNNPEAPVSQMINLLDASIPLLASMGDESGDNNGAVGTGGSWGYGSNGDGSSDSGDAAPMGSTPSNTTVSGKIMGLSVGIVAGTAAYGAAMFLVARRYRQRRAGRHGRTNSINRSVSPGSNPASGLMASGGAVMHGAARFDHRGSGGSGGRASARTAQISAPMMAENSLGWN
ncbi:hypothetical protein DFP73DRAFT_277909 [Morchella snyderi]|nr:hypothetical protein DFP73DRAFT_277909 [Morchella snyderi]